MKRLVLRLLAPVTLLTVLALFLPAVQAEDQCVPISGMLYGWFTDSWHGEMTLTIGRNTRNAKLVARNIGFVNSGDVYRGMELWTIDFGNGDTIQVKTHFICEHITDAVSASGVFHVTEGGLITGGTGAYGKAYGNYLTEGPFGPAVKLPKDMKTPAEAQAYWINAGVGTICVSK